MNKNINRNSNKNKNTKKNRTTKNKKSTHQNKQKGGDKLSLRELNTNSSRDVKKASKIKFGILPKIGANTIKGKFCSPSREGNFSCFSRKSLRNIAKKWNEKNKTQKIKLTKNVKKLWNRIDEKLKSHCRDEKCWSDKVQDHKSKENFRPDIPKEWLSKPHEWLSTIDIEKVLKQYQSKYKDFLFIGPVPMDFDSSDGFGSCIVNELCNINLEKLHKKGVRRIGIVFNLDYHDQPGSHWVALFVSMLPEDPNFGVHYFDSYASPPTPEVKNLADRLVAQSKNIKFSSVENYHTLGGQYQINNEDQQKNSSKQFEFTYNKVRHQYKNSECGMYCINFINNALEKKARRTKQLTDDAIHKMRMYYYYPSNQSGGGQIML